MWKLGLLQVIDAHGCGWSVHKTHWRYTGDFDALVGSVGKSGPHQVVGSWFSNSPEMHRRDLENPNIIQVTGRKREG